MTASVDFHADCGYPQEGKSTHESLFEKWIVIPFAASTHRRISLLFQAIVTLCVGAFWFDCRRGFPRGMWKSTQVAKLGD